MNKETLTLQIQNQISIRRKISDTLKGIREFWVILFITDSGNKTKKSYNHTFALLTTFELFALRSLNSRSLVENFYKKEKTLP